jgi:hypothetical protein
VALDNMSGFRFRPTAALDAPPSPASTGQIRCQKPSANESNTTHRRKLWGFCLDQCLIYHTRNVEEAALFAKGGFSHAATSEAKGRRLTRKKKFERAGKAAVNQVAQTQLSLLSSVADRRGAWWTNNPSVSATPGFGLG